MKAHDRYNRLSRAREKLVRKFEPPLFSFVRSLRLLHSSVGGSVGLPMFTKEKRGEERGGRAERERSALASKNRVAPSGEEGK